VIDPLTGGAVTTVGGLSAWAVLKVFATGERVSSLAATSKQLDERLDRIESKLDTLLSTLAAQRR
jgi:hypothetical protein